MSMLNEIDTEFESRNVFRTREEKVEIKNWRFKYGLPR